MRMTKEGKLRARRLVGLSEALDAYESGHAETRPETYVVDGVTYETAVLREDAAVVDQALGIAARGRVPGKPITVDAIRRAWDFGVNNGLRCQLLEDLAHALFTMSGGKLLEARLEEPPDDFVSKYPEEEEEEEEEEELDDEPIEYEEEEEDVDEDDEDEEEEDEEEDED